MRIGNDFLAPAATRMVSLWVCDEDMSSVTMLPDVDLLNQHSENRTRRSRAATHQCSSHDHHLNPQLHEKLADYIRYCHRQYDLTWVRQSNPYSRYESLNTLAGGTVAFVTALSATRNTNQGCKASRRLCRLLHRMLC